MRFSGYYLIISLVSVAFVSAIFAWAQPPEYMNELESFCGGMVLRHTVTKKTPDLYVIKFMCFADMSTEYFAYIPRKGGNDATK